MVISVLSSGSISILSKFSTRNKPLPLLLPCFSLLFFLYGSLWDRFLSGEVLCCTHVWTMLVILTCGQDCQLTWKRTIVKRQKTSLADFQPLSIWTGLDNRTLDQEDHQLPIRWTNINDARLSLFKFLYQQNLFTMQQGVLGFWGFGVLGLGFRV